jgi:hypothetical protein
MTAPKAIKLGPGLLTLGEVGSPIDISCLLSKAKVSWDKDKEDDTAVLCGDTIAGAVSYTAKLAGTLAQDIDNVDGIVQFSWDHKGEQVPFVFVPNTAAGRQVTGTVTVDPLTVGGDEVKKNMMSDFEWDCVGEPVLGPTTPATGATAGAPGAFTPAGSAPPVDIVALGPIVAAPQTAWAAGSYVTLGDGSRAYWDATAWVVGTAP